jgi:hypothetical protein
MTPRTIRRAAERQAAKLAAEAMTASVGGVNKDNTPSWIPNPVPFLTQAHRKSGKRSLFRMSQNRGRQSSLRFSKFTDTRTIVPVRARPWPSCHLQPVSGTQQSSFRSSLERKIKRGRISSEVQQVPF